MRWGGHLNGCIRLLDAADPLAPSRPGSCSIHIHYECQQVDSKTAYLGNSTSVQYECQLVRHSLFHQSNCSCINVRNGCKPDDAFKLFVTAIAAFSSINLGEFLLQEAAMTRNLLQAIHIGTLRIKSYKWLWDNAILNLSTFPRRLARSDHPPTGRSSAGRLLGFLETVFFRPRDCPTELECWKGRLFNVMFATRTSREAWSHLWWFKMKFHGNLVGVVVVWLKLGEEHCCMD